ncbi:methyltransferase domain-containing protein [Polychytrium aggregatum]|uniref:methyltransferase domain-containing protein n=1 Tax=Polychytrium aggregatum TaxID=110093 RepID=UPI0022FEEA7F|nr:methyltransferase domain-containing protein [Polychytrium aggregatum]KAI9204598.1 methyltransferase domain-containing protein [Polychytrium aggregatum]
MAAFLAGDFIQLPDGQRSPAEYLATLAEFIAQHSYLTSFYGLHFITQDYWRRSAFPREWAVLADESWESLEAVASSGQIQDQWPASLKTFIRQAHSIGLPRDPAACPLFGDVECRYLLESLWAAITNGMNRKKLEEVTSLAAIIAHIANTSGCTHVLDIGAGQGYLSSALAYQYGLDVVCLDGSGLQLHGGQSRSAHIERLLEHHKMRQGGRLRFVEMVLKFDKVAGQPSDDEPQIVRQIRQLIQDSESTSGAAGQESPSAESRWLICGLHTCGDLAPTMLKSIVPGTSDRSGIPQARVVVNVGCCYHVLTERDVANSATEFHARHQTDDGLEQVACGFPMSKVLKDQGLKLGLEARMVACQAARRWAPNPKQTRQSFRRLFYRAVLQAILNDHREQLPAARQPEESTGSDARPQDISSDDVLQRMSDYAVRRLPSAAFESPLQYISAALDRLGVAPDSPLRDPAVTTEYFERHAAAEKQIAVVWTLRALMADAIESLILVDRWMYLVEQANERRAALAASVGHDCCSGSSDGSDRELASPRNMALIVVGL